MAGKAVAQAVRVQVFADGFNPCLGNAQLHGAGADAPSFLANKQGIVRRGKLRPQSQPIVQSADGFTTDRQHAAFAAFAKHSDEALAAVEVLHIQADQFGKAQSRGVKQLQNGFVAAVDKVLCGKLIEQLRGAIDIQDLRQAFYSFGRA